MKSRLRLYLGEYPAGSVSCAESTGELKGGTRNRWFILFTNCMIDWGFVIGAFVPYVVAAAAQNKYYGTIWRTSLGIGVVFPLVLFVLRLRLKEPEEFSRNSMKRARTPYLLVLKFYGFRLLIVSLIWFIYDVSAALPLVRKPQNLTCSIVLYLCLRYILQPHLGQYLWLECTPNNHIRMEHGHQLVLYPWNHARSSSQ